MTSPNGNPVPNQFIIETEEDIIFDSGIGSLIETCTVKYFQSYESVIAKKVPTGLGTYQIYLDETYWDYSRTTGKYRNMFLNETKKETQKKIDSGEYRLVDLN